MPGITHVLASGQQTEGSITLPAGSVERLDKIVGPREEGNKVCFFLEFSQSEVCDPAGNDDVGLDILKGLSVCPVDMGKFNGKPRGVVLLNLFLNERE